MTIAEYQNLTGLTVAESDISRIQAVIRRCETKLESLLGYSLSRPNYWTELGQVQYNGSVPFPSLPMTDEAKDNLLAPDSETGNIQLFNFDPLDTYFRINTAKEVYKVKIVMPINSSEFVTIHTLDSVVPYLNHVGLVTAIARYTGWFSWTWWTSLILSDKSKLMLAVDADYIDLCDICNYPELAYLLADMVTYYSDSNYSLLGAIKSESIDSHSYSRASTGSNADSSSPEGQPSAKKIIEKYSGPGVFRKLVK